MNQQRILGGNSQSSMNSRESGALEAKRRKHFKKKGVTNYQMLLVAHNGAENVPLELAMWRPWATSLTER